MSTPPEPTSGWRAVDARLFRLEGALVTFAAAAMVATVTLDILFRALKGAQTAPLAQLLTLWGSVGPTPAADLPVSYGAPLTFALLSFGFGWGVYRASHRGEEGASAQAIKVGALTLIGLYAFSVALRNTPSWLMCAGLSLVAGGALVAHALKRGEAAQAGGLGLATLVTAGLSTKLPQDYIWSQELSLILLAWLAFVGGSMATYQQKHIEISALAKVIPERLRPWVRPLSLAVTGLVSAYVCALLFESAFGARGSWVSGEVRPATQIPTWVILLAGVVSFGLIALRSLLYSVALFRDPQSLPEKEDLH